MTPNSRSGRALRSLTPFVRSLRSILSEVTSLAALRSNYSQLTSDLKKVKRTLALTFSLRKFFGERVTVARAKEEIKRALETREERFLELIQNQVYDCANSPYLKLLRNAGCEFSDLRAQVHHHGLEKTLERLAKEGVYLTSQEFKGKKEVVRGGQSFRFFPADLEDNGSSPGFLTQSSGSSSRAVRSFTRLERLVQQAYVTCLTFYAHDLFSPAHAVYDAILPGSSGINQLLYRAKLGIRTERWFAREIPFNSRLEGIYFFLVTYLFVLAGKWFGPGFPRPEFIDITNVGRIVRWVLEKRRESKSCCIRSSATNAVRIAQAAWNMGVSLEGTKFLVGGEPLTEAKRDAIARLGAHAIPRYSFSGGGNVGNGCASPRYTDEIHVNQHMMTLVQHPNPIGDYGQPIRPILFTNLDASAGRLLFNVDIGDYATVATRDCGCVLGQAGLTLHLHHIRSYEKFTSEGMNYFYGDLYKLFESVFPREFGGGPGDYQLVEEEDASGQTRLTLLVHPNVGRLDEAKILARLQAALANGSRGNCFMAGVWQNAGTFRVRREVPYASPRGKILPLHLGHSKAHDVR